MTCTNCGGQNLTPHVVWTDGGHEGGYFLCGACGAVSRPEDQPVPDGEPAVEVGPAVTTDALLAVLLEGKIADVEARVANETDLQLLTWAHERDARKGVKIAIEERFEALAAAAAAAPSGEPTASGGEPAAETTAAAAAGSE